VSPRRQSAGWMGLGSVMGRSSEKGRFLVWSNELKVMTVVMTGGMSLQGCDEKSVKEND